jgi:hypothetical protein
VNGPVNSRDWRDSVDRKWPYSRASAQVRLVADMYAAAGVTIGVHLNGDEVDFVYEEGTLLVRDAYVDQWSRWARSPPTCAAGPEPELGFGTHGRH